MYNFPAPNIVNVMLILMLTEVKDDQSFFLTNVRKWVSNRSSSGISVSLGNMMRNMRVGKWQVKGDGKGWGKAIRAPVVFSQFLRGVY